MHFSELFKIGTRLVGENQPPFIIAEMSGNHNQSIDNAIKIVDAAYKAGADAIKLQTYTADTITLNEKEADFKINDSKSLWDGKYLHGLYKKAYTPWDWHPKIFEHAKKLGLICFSSPFDETAIDFLESLQIPAYKIASFENNHIPLIRMAASTGKPLIISTGMASVSDLDRLTKCVNECGCEKLVLLKCTSTYPASPQNTNILTIPHMRNLFKTQVGLSDHTLGIGVSVAAVSHGATVIEKHLTLSRSEGGVDSAFSLEPDEFKLLVEETKRAHKSLGGINYGPTEAEKKSSIFRRSIYCSKDIKKGECFSSENIRIVRPGYGAPPYFYDMLIGKTAKISYKKGLPIKIDDLL